jgi:hypothetical protein
MDTGKVKIGIRAGEPSPTPRNVDWDIKVDTSADADLIQKVLLHKGKYYDVESAGHRMVLVLPELLRLFISLIGLAGFIVWAIIKVLS